MNLLSRTFIFKFSNLGYLVIVPHAPCPMPNAQCPMPHALPNAQCPMPNAQLD
ncbi:hypothetical protein [Nostoc sp. CHAB 5715]|uniref:hypothetical protein n=1 Tax=Nostoc sp. CHAB 5715 TaxID=2780400 RepID=UPI001E3DE824|nr:hypothetical protein [Nostoc sp. CHAB 5715]MCC5623754.1 hypothetical protein [Nostoc sp. CHAB 5715]